MKISVSIILLNIIMLCGVMQKSVATPATSQIIADAKATKAQTLQTQGASIHALALESLARAGRFNHQLPDMSQLLSSGAPQTQQPPQAILFVSLGMPDQLLRQYLQEGHRYHIPLVIRGLINNDFKATVTRLTSLLLTPDGKKIDGGISIDPLWFRHYAIKTVPTFVVSAGQTTPCPANANCAPPAFDQINGNLTLKAALTRIAEQNDAPSLVAKQYLAHDHSIHHSSTRGKIK